MMKLSDFITMKPPEYLTGPVGKDWAEAVTKALDKKAAPILEEMLDLIALNAASLCIKGVELPDYEEKMKKIMDKA